MEDILKKIEDKAHLIASKIEFEVEYLPGTIESLDMYRASLDRLDVSAYGPTKEIAIENARVQVVATFLQKPSLMDKPPKEKA